MPTQGLCLNCGATLDGRFCRACGQDANVALRPWRELVAEWGDAVLGWESRTGRTVRALLFEPGRLTAEYAAGRRAAWVHPLRVYLGANVVALAVFGATAQPIYDHFAAEFGPDGEINHMGAMVLRISAAFVVLVPLGAAIYALAFRGLKRFYAEHLVFNLHCTAFGFAIHAAASLLQYLTVIAGWPALLAVATRVAAHAGTAYYLYAAARRTYGLGPWPTLWRLAVVTCLAIPLVSLTAFLMTGRPP